MHPPNKDCFKPKTMNAEQENLKNTKPCPYDSDVPCVQYLEDDPCDCDPCELCQIKIDSKQSKRIGIIGSRRRNEIKDYTKVWAKFFEIYEPGDTIVSGGCKKGGDKFAEMINQKYGIPIKIFKPDWSIGRHAGLLRNTDIAMYSDVLIACVALNRKGGTEDTIKKFKRMHPDKPIHIVV